MHYQIIKPAFMIYYFYIRIYKDNEAKVCFITAYEEFLNDFRRLFPDLQEVDCFIRKPVEMDNLVKIVKSKIDYN